MSVVKGKTDYRVVLDFSNEKCSKNKVKMALRKAEILNLQFEQYGHTCTRIQNIIKIGMYTIRLWLPGDTPQSWNKLKDYGDFEIDLYDTSKSIDMTKDSRFKGQYWSNMNFFGKLRIKHLIDIIMHCNRLNRLSAFL
jgi:hypothetical protein